jgi:hypothetical protein
MIISPLSVVRKLRTWLLKKLYILGIDIKNKQILKIVSKLHDVDAEIKQFEHYKSELYSRLYKKKIELLVFHKE